MEEVLCIYGKDPIGFGGAYEANGTIFVFCSEHCRTEWAKATNAVLPDWEQGDTPIGALCDGSVCDECGKVL